MRIPNYTTSLRIDPDRCAGCGMCLNVCPHAVIAIEEGKAIARAPERCMECGACRMNCPLGAIAVQAGVGCAQAILRGMLGGKAPSCGCSCGDEAGACC